MRLVPMKHQKADRGERLFMAQTSAQFRFGVAFPSEYRSGVRSNLGAGHSRLLPGLWLRTVQTPAAPQSHPHNPSSHHHSPRKVDHQFDGVRAHRFYISYADRGVMKHFLRPSDTPSTGRAHLQTSRERSSVRPIGPFCIPRRHCRPNSQRRRHQRNSHGSHLRKSATGQGVLPWRCPVRTGDRSPATPATPPQSPRLHTGRHSPAHLAGGPGSSDSRDAVHRTGRTPMSFVKASHLSRKPAIYATLSSAVTFPAKCESNS